MGNTKRTLDDLAIFGGVPAFDEKLHVGRPNIGDRRRLLERFEDILDRRWLTNDGPYVQEFEDQVANIVGVRHCVATCNATVGLEIAIRALGLSGEVIVPSMTFIATAHALQWSGITPVFCDIDPETHNMDPAKVESLITPLTTGIVGVHLWGRPCEIDKLQEISTRHNVALVFDAAHAFGCSSGKRMIGNFGDAEVFSFHATKFLNAFEGGAIVTNDDDLAPKLRLMKNFGFSGYDEVSYLGTNGKMNETSAAMGITSLESLEDIVAVNRTNYEQYKESLDRVPGVSILHYADTNRNNYQYVVLEVNETLTGISRDELISILWAENVMARRYFYPGCHRMEPYRSLYPQAGLALRETERLVERVLLLPTGTTITPSDASTISGVIEAAVSRGCGVQQRLAGLATAAAEGSGSGWEA